MSEAWQSMRESTSHLLLPKRLSMIAGNFYILERFVKHSANMATVSL